MSNTPVALIIFRRPELTRRVMEVLARVKPGTLLVVADGPRENHPEDAEACAATRAVIECVNWKCEVIKNYSDVNLGCGRRPASGISWVFEKVPEAIILEDDCVPHPSYFPFCGELLEKYRDDARVVQISGNNLHFGGRHGTDSYFFSRHNVCAGGWASWRRAWQHFDYHLNAWRELRRTNWLESIVDIKRAMEYWTQKFDKAYARGTDLDFWDYQWTFACWAQNGLTAIPNVQLLSNIGFNADATHSKSGQDRWANLPTAEMTFPLRHPMSVQANCEADRLFIEQVVAGLPMPKRRWRRVLARMTPRPVRKALSISAQWIPKRSELKHFAPFHLSK